MDSNNNKAKFALCSKSKLKLEALLPYMSYNLAEKHDLDTIKGSDTGSNQPFGIENTFTCAKKRADDVKGYDFVISIENGAFINDHKFPQDICAVIIKDCSTGKIYSNKDKIMETVIMIPDGKSLYENVKINGISKNKLGYNITFGRLLSDKYKVPDNNWMEKLCNFPRQRQIGIGLKYVFGKLYVDNKLITD